MIYLTNILSGKQQRIRDVASLKGVLQAAGIRSLTKQEKTALRSLIHDDQVKKTYGMLQGAELLQDIRSRIHSIPRAFDDMSFMRRVTRLGETSETVAQLEEIEYRVRNTVKTNIVRIWAGGSSPLLNKELGLYGFCNLSSHILKSMGEECLFVCVGRSPTPIAAWLQTRTPRVCLLPFSGARLENMKESTLAEARKRTHPHFEKMLLPLIGSARKIVLVDYSTSGESILTVYNMILDFLEEEKVTSELVCVSLWASAKTMKAAAFGMEQLLQESRTRTNKGKETATQRIIRTVFGDKFLTHLCLKELVDDQFNLWYTYATRWSQEMRERMLEAMMDMLDNQSFDFLSPYKKSPILEGAKAAVFMSEEGLRRFEQLKQEMLRAEKDHRELEKAIMNL